MLAQWAPAMPSHHIVAYGFWPHFILVLWYTYYRYDSSTNVVGISLSLCSILQYWNLGENLIHKVETIAACITFLRHRRRRRRRRRCLCGNSSEQYSIALDSIISIRGCDREALDRSTSSSIAASPECAAQERRQLCTAIYSCLVRRRRRRRRRERSEVFASTAYLLTWSWLLTDCPGTYVRT